MTTFHYSQIDNGDTIAFDPDTDVLDFDAAQWSAADFMLTVLPDDAGIQFTGGGKSFTLTGVDLSFLGEGTVTFADGSMLVNSCPANGYAKDLSGTVHDDLLLGTSVQPLLRASETQDGVAANNTSGMNAVSADGRYVVFSSSADNLIGDGVDTNSEPDIFLKDMLTGAVTRVSTNAAGDEATGGYGIGSDAPHASSDGRYVIFSSWARNLVAGDTNQCQDVFLKDTLTGAVVRVTESSAGVQGNNTSFFPTMSTDHRYVTFMSYASNLVAGDTNQASDIFVKDLVTGNVVLASSSATGEGGNADADGLASFGSMISADGHFVVLESYSSNLVSGDDNASKDVFVKNLLTGAMVCASADASGDIVAGRAENASISADGRYVAFESSGALLHDGQEGAGSIYRRDLQTGELTRVTGASEQYHPLDGPTAMSSDGRYIAFSTTSALAGDDTNDAYDVYVKDMQTGAVARVSVGNSGQQTDGSYLPQISADGSTIVFAAGPELNGGTGPSQIFSVGNPLFGRILRGGAGNDVYQVGSGGDRIVEAAGQGTDTVRSTATSFTLAANVERLVLAGDAAIDGHGNSLNNIIIGNANANGISGGAGNDQLDGGAGNDTAAYDDATSAVTVNLSITTAQATGGAGSDKLANFENLVGSAFNDHLTGTAAANVLDGRAGADTLTGGFGNDTYVIDSLQDVIVEQAGGGTDTVRTALSFTLQAELENLTLLGNVAINGTGNASANALVGNAAANILNGGVGADTLTGGGGNDIYVVDNAGDQVVETAFYDLDSVRASVSWTLGDELENLTLAGTGNINGTGNGLANLITGNAGANVLAGGTGQDTLVGGGGNDVYILLAEDFAAPDTVVEQASGGIDEVRSISTYTLGAELENLTLLDGARDGYGNDKANKLTGNDDNNTLDGKAGADQMAGGDGNDYYVVDNTGDQVIEADGNGTEDRVESSVSWTMGAYVEYLTLTGSAAINATGNAQRNLIGGNSAANVLDGGGGADYLSGGAGNDTYIVDDIHDDIYEDTNGGTDRVQSSVSYTLFQEIEQLVLTGTAAINGIGNGIANQMTGNSAGNVLTGNGGDDTLNGGTGSDTLYGGIGNDTYVVENAGDLTVEAASGGIDLVQSSINFMLQNQVENLTLTGSTAINGLGNELANVISGNNAANVLNGDAGADTLSGRGGNDTYIVDNAGDKVIETASGGLDSVQSSVTFTLQAEVERLILTGVAAINGVGNTLANIVTGNGVANVIDGKAGADTMTGGGGNDIFSFSTALASDVITDFTSGADRLNVRQSAFKVGDGDTTIEGAVAVNGPNGFASSAELVIVTHDINGNITAATAAAAIGHANSAYAVGDTRLFVVDNGVDSGVYLFKSSDANSIVSAGELTLVATLDNTHATTVNDYLFGA